MWVYDDYEWWANAVHRAACPAANPEYLGSENLGDQVPTPALIESGYRECLAALRCGSLSPDTARRLLFCRKALRKWRLSIPVPLAGVRSKGSAGYARLRREAALSGFAERNGASHLAEPIPYPYDVWMRDVLREWLPRPNPDSEGRLITGRFGPGACAERWSHCKRFTRLKQWCAQGEHWPEVPESELTDADNIVVRLCAVPKTAVKDRLITVEPAYRTFVQQYARQYILESIHEGPLRGTAMDLGYTDGQAQQRMLALRASKNKRLATLDLSDASDRIGWVHVQQVFPAHVLSLLESTRSWYYRSGHDTNCIEPLRVYAGMGNATTFPVETLFFAAFVYAYARAHGLPTFVSVFGDDIICTSQWARHFCENGPLRFPFFAVGADKSFWGADGLRESCGIFAYHGFDISSPKIDGYSPNWRGRLGLADLHRRLLDHKMPETQCLAHLIAEAGYDAGIENWPFQVEGYPSISDDLVSSYRGYSSLPQTRWNRGLQRKEAWVKILHPRYSTYSLDCKRSKRFNSPAPEEFLPGVLLGQVGSSQAATIKDGCRPKSGCTSVRFVLDESYHVGHAWRPVGR